MSAYHGLSHLEHGAVIPDGFDNRFMDLLHFYWEDKMGRIFTIGTRKRCTRVLEEQAQRAVDNAKSAPVVALEDAIQSIDDGEYSDAILNINAVISNLQSAINDLNSAVTNINGGYYEQAVSQITQAITYVR